MSRPSTDEYFTNMVKVVATRGSCVRRRTGAIAVSVLNHILGTGYNGRPRNFMECTISPCTGSRAKSGSDLDKCEAIHAEANALLQCPDVNKINTLYCTTKPCVHCMKLICNTGCVRVVYLEDYPHEEVDDLAARANIKLEQYVEVV